MATESVRESILANIKTSLENIDGEDDYWTGVSSVSRVLVLPHDLSSERKPGLLVIAAGEPEQVLQEHGYRSRHDLAVGIVGVMERQPDDVGTDLNRFMKDVTVALTADVTRGGFASQTWKQSQLDVSNMFSNIAVFEMDFLIRFFTDSREE